LNTSLIFMAAGLGSRFGGGVKQLEKVGPHGEVLMDYAIHDGLSAGFDKVVFIIRKDIEDDFRDIIGKRIEKKCDVSYAYQDLYDIPAGIPFPEGRTKVWGTGQAVLACRGIVKEPFCVLNADDFYGRKALELIHGHLVNSDSNAKAMDCCMAGYVLGNTLSDNGAVTRGVCMMDNEGYLSNIDETKGIVKTACGGAEAKRSDDTVKTLSLDSLVSMNMWGLPAKFIDILEDGFAKFIRSLPEGDITSEYLVPEIMQKLVLSGEAKVKVLKTDDKWFGMTYKEDKEFTVECLRDLISKGIYPESLM